MQLLAAEPITRPVDLRTPGIVDGARVTQDLLDQLVWSTHALDRFCERVNPSLVRGQAREQLKLLASRVGRVSVLPPAWALGTGGHETLFFLRFGDEIALPVSLTSEQAARAHGTSKPYVVTTCLTRNWLHQSLPDLREGMLASSIMFSRACQRKFRERVAAQPDGADIAAWQELWDLTAAHGRLAERPPAWVDTEERKADMYLLIGEEIVIPVVHADLSLARADRKPKPLVALTVFTRWHALEQQQAAAVSWM